MDEREQKQLLMDLEVVMKSNECPCIVQFYGALFKEVYNSGDITRENDKNNCIILSYHSTHREIVGFAWNLWIRR